MVLPDSHGISRVPRYSGTCPASHFVFVYGVVTLYDQPFQTVRLTRWLVTRRPYGLAGPTTPPCMHDGLGYVRVRSPLLAESRLISIPAGTEMVHFPALPSMAYVFSHGYPGITLGGLPHSEISGSKPVCGSPELIAAYHVLHRLLAPRHSPYALSSLTTAFVTSADRPRRSARRKSSDALLSCFGRKLPFAGYSVVKESVTRSIARRFENLMAASPLLVAKPLPRVSSAVPRRASAQRPSRTCREAKAGGEYRARTGDLLVANQALSQLS